MRQLMLFAVVAAVFGAAGVAGAQDRMPPIPADKLTEAQKKADRRVQGRAVGRHLRPVRRRCCAARR